MAAKPGIDFNTGYMGCLFNQPHAINHDANTVKGQDGKQQDPFETENIVDEMGKQADTHTDQEYQANLNKVLLFDHTGIVFAGGKNQAGGEIIQIPGSQNANHAR